MSERTPAAISDIERTRRRLLDGLMSSDASAWEHSLLRTRLFSPDADPERTWARRSLLSFVERAGQHGTDPRRAQDLAFNRQVSLAHASLERREWWERRGVDGKPAGSGPHTPYETRLCDAFPAERRSARSELAYAAIRSLSLHVSPLGPERERALCDCWYRARFDGEGLNVISGSRKDWARWLGVSRRWAVQWLCDIEACDVGLSVRELAPAPGRKAPLFAVSLRLPDLGALELPRGAARARRLQAEFEALAERSPQRTAASDAESASSPRSQWVDAGGVGWDDCDDEDLTAPWDE